MGDQPRTGMTLRDLARLLGVSKTTVSNAFSRPDQLSAELRDRILAAARAAGYGGPDAVARMLRTRRAGALGLILPESLPDALDDGTVNELIRGIADACEERRLGLVIVPGVRHEAHSQTISAVAVDGFVAYSLPRDAPGLAAALERRLPLAIVDQPRVPGATIVGIDDTDRAREVAEHLLALGHRRLAIIALPFGSDGSSGFADDARVAARTFDVAYDRLVGYREALAAAQIGPAEVPVYECAHSSEALGSEAARAIFGLPSRPTAILAMSDRLAIGAAGAARRAGKAIPDDLSIVGFDDLAAGAHHHPPLTTVRQPHRLKGYTAARLVLDGAAAAHGAGAGSGDGGSDQGAPVAGGRFALPSELLVRRSTGAPRNDREEAGSASS